MLYYPWPATQHPTIQPPNHPTIQPSNHPTIQPSNQPSIHPTPHDLTRPLRLRRHRLRLRRQRVGNAADRERLPRSRAGARQALS
ncbi:MAG TPA: PT domain-containing protein [Anaerolineae bacterium]